MTDGDDNLLPLSALQHLLYCERQCALIHIEQAWEENRFTAEGRVLHERAHEGPDEHRAGVHITRGLPVRSLVLGLSGQCDVVEFHLRPDAPLPRRLTSIPREAIAAIVPIEYKRGRPKTHLADEVQLCAQALCLEDMLGCPIEVGHLYYGQRHQRSEVRFDANLRAATQEAAARLQALVRSGRTPPPVYDAGKCDDCSLIEVCLPKVGNRRGTAAHWFADSLKRNLED